MIRKIAFVLSLLSPALLSAQSLTREQAEQRARTLLKQMTLDEKIGQLNQSAGIQLPMLSSDKPDALIAQGRVGSILWLVNSREINRLQHIAVEKSRLHIPILFGFDVIHGYRTAFPVPLAMASSWDPNVEEQAQRFASQDARAAGIQWTFTPMVDIARDARWGRIVEGAGEDPYLGSAMARAYVRGYQGERLSDSNSIAACVKHYVAYGAAEGGRDYNTVEMSERTLRQVYLPPFHAAVDAGAVTLMSAFNALNGIPTTASHFTLTEVLRDEWKFRGFVVSDYTSVHELIQHGIALDAATAALKALLAGVDMDMVDGDYQNLIQGVRSGTVPQAAVDEAARRILRVKFALGLFDNPYVKVTPRVESIPPEYLETARKVAKESFVLLKNAPVGGGGPILPINAGVKTIALIGPLGDDAPDMLGPWAGAATSPKDVVTLRAQLAERAGPKGIKLLYAKGTEIWGESDSGFAEAVAAARQADIVLMALGEDAASSGEAGSRAHLGLPGNQQQLLEAVSATGKPVVGILFNGHPLTLGAALPDMAALLEAWFPGVQAGPALVHTLFGDVNPSGKLTVTFPRAVGQEPLYYNALNTGRPADGVDFSQRPGFGGERWHSRYIDENNSGLFPFGYGLSYTTFKYSAPELSSTKMSARALNEGGGQPLKVSAEVKNTGSRAGDEIVQLYIRQQGTSVARPVRELKGFQRISLQPGETKKVEFTLGRDELRFSNIDMKNVVEPAHVTVCAGPSSAEGACAEVEITD